jgi:hypothetical protein
MHSRAEQYRRWGLAAQQRATEARDPKIKAAFEDVAHGWFAACRPGGLAGARARPGGPARRQQGIDHDPLLLGS